MRHRTVAIALALEVLLCSAIARPARAVVERIAGVAPERIAETITAAAGRLLITLRNSPTAGQQGGDQPLQLRPEPTFRPLAEGPALPASWTRLSTGLAPENGRFTLGASETATFEVRGTFPSAGSWETALDVLAPDGVVASRFVLSVIRAAQPPLPPIPSDLLLETRPASIQLLAWELETADTRHVRLVGRNAGTETLRLRGADVGRVSQLAGQAEVAVAPVGRVAVARGGCVGTLPPQHSCALTLDLPASLAPGRYVAEVLLAGEDGGQSVRNQTIEVRASAWWAGGIAALGALLGALTTGWRSSGRRLVEARIMAAERRRQLGLIENATTWPAARRATRHLMERLRDLDGAIRRGNATPDLTPHDERMQTIAAAVEAHAAAERLPAAQAALLVQPRQALAAALDAAAAGATLDQDLSKKIVAATVALRGETAAVEGLMHAAEAADAALGSVGPKLRGVLAAAQAVPVTAWQELEDARDDAFAPVAKGESVADRAAALQRLSQRLVTQVTGDTVVQAVQQQAKQLLDATPQDQRLQAAEQAARELQPRWGTLPADQRLRLASQYAADHAGAFDRRLETAAAVPPAVPPGIPSLLPAGGGLTLDLDGLLAGPARVASLDELRGFWTRWTWFTNGAVLVGIGAAAVPVLWVGNPVWGSPTDLVTALLAGIGTRLAIGTVAQQS